jgi:hypothetical protein
MDKAELILQHLERNLGADLKRGTNLPQELAFQFARKYVQHIRTMFAVEGARDGHK